MTISKKKQQKQSQSAVALQRAMAVTRSWSESWGLKVEPPSPPGPYLIIQGKRISFEAGPGYDLTLNPREVIVDGNLKRVFGELDKMCALVGHKRPAEKRAMNAAKRAKKDDYLTKALLLTGAEKAPAPSDAIVKKWLPVMKREADGAYRRYYDLSRAVPYDNDDYLAVAYSLSQVFFHRKADVLNEDRNGALLTMHLREKFKLWARVTREHMKSVTPDSRILIEEAIGKPVPGAVLSTAFDRTGELGGDPIAAYTMQECEPEQEVVYPSAQARTAALKAEARLEAKSAASKHRAAKAALADGLANMPHDKLVEALANVLTSSRFDFETKALAQKLFRAHLRECKPCRAADDAHEQRLAAVAKLRTPSERAEARLDELAA